MISYKNYYRVTQRQHNAVELFINCASLLLHALPRSTLPSIEDYKYCNNSVAINVRYTSTMTACQMSLLSFVSHQSPFGPSSGFTSYVK